MNSNKWTFTALLGLTTLVTTATLFTSVPAQADVPGFGSIPQPYTETEIKKNPDPTGSNQIQIEGKINLDSNAGVASINCSNVKIEVNQEQPKNGSPTPRKSDSFYEKLAATNGRPDCRYSISFKRSSIAAVLNFRISATTEDANLSGSSTIENPSFLENNYTADVTLHRVSSLR